LSNKFKLLFKDLIIIFMVNTFSFILFNHFLF
jgi:hypothetical protein